MIVANLATYPLRVSQIGKVLSSVSPQVDQLNIVLNQIDTVPKILSSFSNVLPILPVKDTKDTGKLYPNVEDAKWVFFIDDDIIYPDDYIARTIQEVEKLGPGRWMCGYHATLYHPLPYRWRKKFHPKRWLQSMMPQDDANKRKTLRFKNSIDAPIIVDVIGTGTAVIRGCDVPPFSYVEDAQKYIDVRMASWCFEQSITPVCLPRANGWLTPIPFDESIYQSFSRRTNSHVNAEIRRFKGKVKGRGQNPLLYKSSLME